MATGSIKFNIETDASPAIDGVRKTEAAVKDLGKEATATQTVMVHAARVEAQAWEKVALTLAQSRESMRSAAAGSGGGLIDIGLMANGLGALRSGMAAVVDVVVKLSESTREFDDSVLKLQTGLNMTQQEAARTMTSLQEVWRTGSSELPQLAETMRQLASVMSNKEAEEWTKTLEDYAVQTGTSIDTLAGKLTKALQDGTVEASELNGMLKSGIPIYDLLAETLGKSKEEIIGMGKAGQITGAALKAALLKGSAAAKEFNDATSADSLQTLSRTADLATQKIAKGFNSALRPALRGLIDETGKLTKIFSHWLDDVGTLFGKITAGVVELGTAVVKWFGSTPGKPASDYSEEAFKRQQAAVEKQRAADRAAKDRQIKADQEARVAQQALVDAQKAEEDKKHADQVTAARTSAEDEIAKMRAEASAAREREAMERQLNAELEADRRAIDDDLARRAANDRADSVRENAAQRLADTDTRRDRINAAAARIGASGDAARSFIERATPRQLALWQQGKARGWDMSDPETLKKVMRGFNPETGKSLVQEQREQAQQAAGGTAGIPRLRSAGTLRERLMGRTVKTLGMHAGDAEAAAEAAKNPYMQPLQGIGDTLKEIADNTAADPVATFA